MRTCKRNKKGLRRLKTLKNKKLLRGGAELTNVQLELAKYYTALLFNEPNILKEKDLLERRLNDILLEKVTNSPSKTESFSRVNARSSNSNDRRF